MFSVVRQSRMKCPHNTGWDSWLGGEQETLCKTDSPHEVGEEALSKRSSLSGESVPSNGGVMVVVVVVVVVVVCSSRKNQHRLRR